MSSNTKGKKNIILFDLSQDTNKSDVESFLSKYKDQIESIQLLDKKPYRAKVSFKEHNSANDCRINMNQRTLKNKSIRIMWEEKDFFQKNKDTKNNLYIKDIPKNKSAREIYDFFLKYGDISSMKMNVDEKGNNNGTAFLSYYSQEDAKKAIEETNGKKIWESDMEVHYQKSTDKNYNNSDNNLKIYLNNLPDGYSDQDLTKLCEEFGKIHICNINKKGKSAIVKYNSEQEAKNAIEKLNNKVIDNKKIIVKELKENYNYNYNHNNKHNYLPQNFYYFANNPMPRYEDSLENNNLYVKNIPYTVNEEDLRNLFGKFGKITSIKLEKDTDKKDEKEATKPILNKGFGYILFEKIEDAKNALMSLNGKNIPGYESWTKPLMIDYFISKEKRQQNLMGNNPMAYPHGMPGQFPPYSPMMFNMPFPNQYNPQIMWNQNYQNMGYNKQRYNKGYPHRGRGEHRYYKNNNYQKKNNTTNNSNTNISNINNNAKEEIIPFDYESFNKLKTKDEKKEFLGDRIFSAIQKFDNKIEEKDIGKITGMIIEIPNEKEIIEILEKPSVLESRIKEALSLINSK